VNDIAILDPQETSTLLSGNRLGTESQTAKIADALMKVIDTDRSVFVAGLSEGNVNSIRTRMYRNDVKVVVRRAVRDGQRGHVLMARRVASR
jgi:hypothetical protein